MSETQALTNPSSFCVSLYDQIQTRLELDAFSSEYLVHTVRKFAKGNEEALTAIPNSGKGSATAITKLLRQCLEAQPITDQSLLKGLARIYKHASLEKTSIANAEKLMNMGKAFSTLAEYQTLPQSTRNAIRVANEIFEVLSKPTKGTEPAEGSKISFFLHVWIEIKASVLEFMESCRLWHHKLPRSVRDGLDAINTAMRLTPINQEATLRQIFALCEIIVDLQKNIESVKESPFPKVYMRLEQLLTKLTGYASTLSKDIQTSKNLA